MSARKVDIAFVLDISDSMAPCIDAVRNHIGRLLEEVQNAKFDWRLEFVAHNMPGRHVYHMESVNCPTISSLYGEEPHLDRFFTTDLNLFRDRLSQLTVSGDEDMLCALDTALDLPFGPANETQRVVILISDEPFETNESEAFQQAKQKVNSIIQKIQDRHVTFLAIMPDGDTLDQLAMVDRSEVYPVEEDDPGMQKADIPGLLRMLGKTISTMTKQSGEDRPYNRALFNQDLWGRVRNFDRIEDSK